MEDKDKTTYTKFCNGSECPEIKQLKARVANINTRLDLIFGGIITVLVTVIAGLLG